MHMPVTILSEESERNHLFYHRRLLFYYLRPLPDRLNPNLIPIIITFKSAGDIRCISGDSALCGLHLRLQEEHHSGYETHHLRE